MAITQLSDKTQVQLRRDLKRPLEHEEGDKNFIQLENVIDDVANIINSLGLLDNIPTMIDEKTNKIATDLQDTSDDLNRRTQAAIDKINQTTAAITEIKRVGDVTHRQMTYAASVYTNEFSEYDDRLLYGIIDTAIKRVREALQANIDNLHNTLHKIANTGNIEDSNGGLLFTRLLNVPRWINETHDDGNSLYIRSVDGTQFRIGDGFFDLFDTKGNTSFRINSKTGNIDVGIIDQTHVSNLGQVARDNNYYSLNNLPTLGDAAHRPTFDTGDVNAIPWNGDSLPTTSVTRALKDYIQSVKDNLKAIANSGNLNDGTGVLDKAHGGRGRGDNSYDGQWFFANGSPSDVTNQGFVIGSSLNNKICGGSDDGTNLSSSSNINIDTWYGVGIRSSINSYTTTWKHDARSGITRQRGDLYLTGVEEKAVVAPSGWLNMKAPSATIRLGYGNMEFYNDGGKRHYVDGNGNGWFSGNVEGQRGTFWSTLEVHGGVELFHKTPFIDWHYDESSDDYTARLIATARDVITLQGSHLNIANSLNVGGRITGGGLGNGAYANFGGDSSAWSMSGSDNEIVRSSQFVDLRNRVDDRIDRLNRFLDHGIFDQSSVEPSDLPWGNTWVPSTGVLRLLITRLWNLKDKYVFDTSDWNTIPWDGGALVTASTLRSVKDQVAYVQSRVANSEQNLATDTVRSLRWVRVVYRAVWNGEGYWGSGNGEVISQVHVYGQVDGGNDYVSVSVLQMYRNGNWYTVTE